MKIQFQRSLNEAAKAIAGTTDEERHAAIANFLRTAMIALLVG